jgi:hypothetical protein
MKRLADLSAGDLERVRVWRYAGENDDTAVVHATDRVALSSREDEVFIAHTQFTLGNGTQHVGFCTPAKGTGLEAIQPVILSQWGLVYFWFDPPPSRESLAAQWQRLGTDRERVFPVHYRCTVPVDGSYVVGTITAEDLEWPA